MIFKTLTGSQKRITRASKYLIDWDSKSKSKIQFDAKQFLKKYWINHVVFEEFPVAGSRLNFDFYNANKKVAVEIHGKQHDQFTPFFHKTRAGFVSHIRRDQQKRDFCELNDIKLIEIYTDKKGSIKEDLNKKTFAKLGVYL
jgi:hypothetical protein